MSDGVVDQIKQKLDIVEVLSEYMRLTKAGRNFKARCPFHGERTPSFMVSSERQIWHCFGCGQGGDIFGFVMKMEGMEFGDALRLLARRAGVVLQKQDPQVQSQKKRLYEICELATKFFKAQLERSTGGEKAQTYLEARGLKKETIKEWRLGWAPAEWRALVDFLHARRYKNEEISQAGLAVEKNQEYYDRFRSRIIFPISDIQGQVIGFGGRLLGQETDNAAKYVNSPQTPLYDKSRVLYGLNKTKTEIRGKEECIIVEGYMDLLMSWQCGQSNVVASSGTALTEAQLGIVGRYTKKLVIAFDADLAGEGATRRSIDLAQKQDFDIRVIALKDKDPADVIKKDLKIWQAAVDSARSIMEFYFDSIFAKFSEKTLSMDNKRKIIGELLPVIKNIASKVEQSEWIKELARRLRVDERDLIADLREIKIKSIGGGVPEVISRMPQSKSRLAGLEERFLGLCLNNPQHLQGLADGWDCDFQDEKFGEIFKQFKKIIQQKVGKDVVGGLRRTLSSELNLQLDYVSLKIQQHPQDETQIASEIEACLKELMVVKIRKRLGSLSLEIQDAQAQDDKNKIRILLEKFSQLSGELIELTRAL